MSSISLFPCLPTLDSGVIGELSRSFSFKVYTDENLFRDTAARFGGKAQKFRKIMYSKTSVFNQFTLEKEEIVNMFQLLLTDKCNGPEQYLFHGFLTSLIPPGLKRDLRVVIVETRDNRIDRTVREGQSEDEAKRAIDDHDSRSSNWTNFLFKKDAYDSTLYDLVISAENRGHRPITKEILNCFLKRAVVPENRSDCIACHH